MDSPIDTVLRVDYDSASQDIFIIESSFSRPFLYGISTEKCSVYPVPILLQPDQLAYIQSLILILLVYPTSKSFILQQMVNQSPNVPSL